MVRLRKADVFVWVDINAVTDPLFSMWVTIPGINISGAVAEGELVSPEMDLPTVAQYLADPISFMPSACAEEKVSVRFDARGKIYNIPVMHIKRIIVRA